MTHFVSKGRRAQCLVRAVDQLVEIQSCLVALSRIGVKLKRFGPHIPQKSRIAFTRYLLHHRIVASNVVPFAGSDKIQRLKSQNRYSGSRKFVDVVGNGFALFVALDLRVNYRFFFAEEKIKESHGIISELLRLEEREGLFCKTGQSREIEFLQPCVTITGRESVRRGPHLNLESSGQNCRSLASAGG